MRRRTWTDNQLVNSAANCTSVRQLILCLGLKPSGGNYKQIAKYLDELNIDTSHFKGKGWNKGMRGLGKPKIKLEDILVSDSGYQSYKLKNRLFKVGLKKAQCEKCGWREVSLDGRIPVELDHINGNSRDNRIENLRILCPNCHSLQATHRGKNRKK